MDHASTDTRVKKLYSPWMLLLCVSGLGINLVFAKTIIFLGIPLYVDNVGSILVAALGGSLPGMAVGFLSNTLSSLSNPISLYYGILTVIIAWFAARFSERGKFKTLQGFFQISGCNIIIGGSLVPL